LWSPFTGLYTSIQLGKLPVNVSLDAYANAVKPDFAAAWQLRFQIQFLFPK
jgi:hypothetical protein